jgi:FKBP-type peptidyl-prolyl cis-trans isomerase
VRQEVETGDKVGVRYTGYLEKTPGSREPGAVFDTNIGGKLLTLTLGEGRVIKGACSL